MDTNYNFKNSIDSLLSNYLVGFTYPSEDAVFKHCGQKVFKILAINVRLNIYIYFQ